MKSDSIFKAMLYTGGVIVALLVVFSFISLFRASWLSIRQFGLKFILSPVWNPVSEKFGALPFITGTLATSILALFISLPFSISIALLVGVYLPDGFLKNSLSYATDLLAGIPSIIYGFWGLFSLVPLMRKLEIKIGILPYGVGILTASIVLAIMIIPYTSSISREVISMVPEDIKEAGFALGATTREVIFKIILPYARSGIFAGILLAFGRAFGETMAVTMVIGNSNFMPKNIFSPANTMASVIANEFTEATKDIHLSSLIQIGLWLFIFTFLINLLGNIVVNKFRVESRK